MRTNCKIESCNNLIEPTEYSGARSVYCHPCDRETAKLRMRRKRFERVSEKVDGLYYRPKHGYVYIISNPTYRGWVKVGCALDATDRLGSFQTATPHRNFTLQWSRAFEDKLAAEREAHNILSNHCKRKSEWFYIKAEEAIEILEKEL